MELYSSLGISLLLIIHVAADLASQHVALAATRATNVCTTDTNCDIHKGQECRRQYEGCPKGQCVCKPNMYQPRHSDECKPIILGYDQCLKKEDCPDSMACQEGKCVCPSGYMTPDGIECLLKHHRLLGQECSSFDHTCVQLGLASRRYTHIGVTCGSRGSCECTGGNKQVGYSCRKWNINERGCSDSYQCQGGALCTRSTCRCPSGYTVYHSQCVKRGATTNLPFGASCDELNADRYCRQGLVCHQCAGVHKSTCVRYNAPETRRSRSGASDLNRLDGRFLLLTCSIFLFTR